MFLRAAGFIPAGVNPIPFVIEHLYSVWTTSGGVLENPVIKMGNLNPSGTGITNGIGLKRVQK